MGEDGSCEDASPRGEGVEEAEEDIFGEAVDEGILGEGVVEDRFIGEVEKQPEDPADADETLVTLDEGRTCRLFENEEAPD